MNRLLLRQVLHMVRHTLGEGGAGEKYSQFPQDSSLTRLDDLLKSLFCGDCWHAGCLHRLLFRSNTIKSCWRLLDLDSGTPCSFFACSTAVHAGICGRFFGRSVFARSFGLQRSAFLGCKAGSLSFSSHHYILVWQWARGFDVCRGARLGWFHWLWRFSFRLRLIEHGCRKPLRRCYHRLALHPSAILLRRSGGSTFFFYFSRLPLRARAT
mmetsp:Transcript_34868/g.81487  ORF Transcript_34868/g.81487 Transcript_34868/m.81487 type:complete len:211 (+) Transcript_34868:1347-1979(+)